MAKPIVVYIIGTGELIGELHSLETAHKIAHWYLGEWPELSPLTVSDRECSDVWCVKLGDCTPLGCDIALKYTPYRELVSHRETMELMGDPAAQREIAEAEAEYARGECITGEEARALFGLPPVAQSPNADRPTVTSGGLPIRVPSAFPVRCIDMITDPVLLRRVVERLRRLQ